MIICGKCGGTSSVTDSRPVHSTVRRRRKCESCGFKWTTFEMGSDLTRSMHNAARLLDSMIQQGRELGKVLSVLDEFKQLTHDDRGGRPRKPTQEARHDA